MQPELMQVMEALFESRPVTAEQMQAAIGAVMDGRCESAEIAAVLTALRMSGERGEHLVGAAQAMRDRVTRIRPHRTGLVDTCGTGGDGLHSFNISTATALVVAACGVPVAKHGNRSVSSSSGSADVLEQLGVAVDLTPEAIADCIDEVGLGFCFAPLLHGAMKYAAPVRRLLGFRTLFNLLGPLTNPASAGHQLLGAPSDHFARLMAAALAELGTDRSLVVCGNNETDELVLWGTNRVFLVTTGQVEELCWSAADFGLPACSAADLRVADARESASVIRTLLSGETGPAADIVLANTAAVLWLTGRAADLPTGVATGREAISSGAAQSLCARLVEWTQAHRSG